MAKKLQDKIAIVTGGASGLGKATARLFAAHGARSVVIADVQDEKGRSVAESIGLDRCSYFHCDVTDEKQVKAMVDWTAATYGGLDVMFSNAGTFPNRVQSILDLDLSVYDKIMTVNARSMAICVNQAAKKMIELGTRGAIVCTASMAATEGSPTSIDYAMSKFAVLGLMRSAVPELGRHGIRINCVSPSAVLTPMAANMGLVTAEDIKNLIGPMTSLKGVTLIEEHIAESALFLASDAAAFVTGHNLVVDGGLNVWLGIPIGQAAQHES